MSRAVASTLILFGATGDLAARMLLPSLYGLHRDGLMPEALKIVATSRSPHDDVSFREHARGALEAHVLDAAVQALDALSCAVVVLLDVVDAPAQFDAFAVVGGLDRGREVLLRERSRCCE